MTIFAKEVEGGGLKTWKSAALDPTPTSPPVPLAQYQEYMSYLSNSTVSIFSDLKLLYYVNLHFLFNDQNMKY